MEHSSGKSWIRQTALVCFFVTGASGRFAPYVARELMANGHEVVLTSRREPAEEFADVPYVKADLACWEDTGCPEVDWDLDYQFKGTLGSILRCYHIDRDKTFDLLYQKLRTCYDRQ